MAPNYKGPDGKWYDLRNDDDYIAVADALSVAQTGHIMTEEEYQETRALLDAIASDNVEDLDRAHTNEPRNPEAKARMNEALAYVRDYTGTFGLILDLKADRRFGTKYMTLTERQVAAVLASKEREQAWARANDERARDPRHIEAREYLDTYTGTFNFLLEMKAHTGSFSDKQVDAILRCKARDTHPQQVVSSRAPGATTTITDGVYQSPDGRIIKVQKAVHGSGNLYAKVFNPDTKEFEYAPGVVNTVRPEWKMTIEQASEFGRLYGRCVNCGRTLTWEKSIERAMGPVCFGRMFS